MEIRGKVHEIGVIQQVTESFKKREMVVAYAENPQFVEYITFQATQDRTTIFDNLQIGQEVSVDFNLRGRPWTNREGTTTYFNSLVAWRVTPLTSQTSGGSTQPNYNDYPAPVDLTGSDDDDLPF
ncbi:hypothetical protein AAW12_08925 [Sphingobacterium sp. Ag1]|uniref:DUF3127 domain-containing protein n=1 Tax=Sphingobacterium sp. Ag1 TaxID=1643451 RepID=UPI000627EE12|nr:DUF3127 domain-containing protein [Sphingobacterium sp. Ag1]KKO91771.1 hypothetical protein AAW12_08925 [Sphingobacterium sp. Ag1]